ncbi:MAG: GAF domain-containing protein [Chloroflexi bacterium]|nr:GAF domain-containing protein [Chloroflexota bacterium]
MGLALIMVFFLGGLALAIWLLLWSRQRERLGFIPDVENILEDVPLVAGSDAVLVSREHGQLIYANDTIRRWLHLDGGAPDIEYIAQLAAPADAFLELFAQNTQASFQIGGRWVEGSSHSIPNGNETRTVVVLRELTTGTHHPDALDLADAMQIVNEIGETVHSGLGLEQVLQALLSIVRKVIPADAGEICLWQPERKLLEPRGWIGDGSYVVALAEAGGVYRLGEGIAGWVALHRKSILIADRDDPQAVPPKLEAAPYRCFVAVPLVLGETFIGTFELAAEPTGQFTQSDLALLQAVAKPIATAIYNAELYTNQARRIEDLASLQQLASNPETDEEIANLYLTLNREIARLLGADMVGVLLHDERRQALVAEPPFFGLPRELVRNYAISVADGSSACDLWTRRVYWRSNDLADEPLAAELNLSLLINAAGLYNVVLMPLVIGSRAIGMLHVGNKRSHGGFTMQDLEHLRLLASQAAVVVEEIRLGRLEQDRDNQITVLQQVSQSFDALREDEARFYGELNARIAQLMGVAMSGVLLYDEHNTRLVARPPFYGLEDHITRDYYIEVPPGSIMAQIWLENDYWYTNRATTDTLVISAGLGDLAALLSVRQTMLAAISSGGNRLGVIQIANKVNGEGFSDRDARLLLIFAAQVGAVIDNKRLFQEAQHRAEEAERLRRIAEMAGAILKQDDDFIPVLAETARLLDSAGVFINVLDSETGQLITHPQYMYGVELVAPIVQDAYSPGFEHSVVISRRPFMSNDVLNDERVLPSYREIAHDHNITRIVQVPLVVGNQSLGELGALNRTSRPYTDEDRVLLAAVGVQLAGALDRVRLYEGAGQNLRRRLHELDAISRVSNELAQTLGLDRVLDVIRQEAARATEAEGNTVALLALPEDWPSANQPLLARRLGERRPTMGLGDIETEAVRHNHDVVRIDDYTQTELLAEPYAARSAMAVAFLYEERIIGVIHVWHSQPRHFDEQAATFLLTMAAKASLGYGNQLRYEENLERSDRLRRRVEQLNQIFELSQLLHSNVDPVTMLDAIAFSVQQSCGYDVVVMTLVDEATGTLRRVAQAGLPIAAFEASKADTMNVDQLHDLLRLDEFRVSESYFLPISRVMTWLVDGMAALTTAFDGNRTLHPAGKSDWADGDMLLVPLNGSGGMPLGMMSVDRPFNGKRPDRSVIEILEIFAHQAAANIENTRLYMASVRSAEEESRVNDLMEAISMTLDIDMIVEAIARGVLQLLPFMRMTVALLTPDQQAFDLIRVTTKADSSIDVSHDRRPSLTSTALGRTFEGGQDFLYRSGDAAYEQFEDLASWHVDGENTSLLLPLMSGGQQVGALHIGSDLRDAFGFEEFRGMLKRIASLAAVAIQNARLFTQAINLRSFNESVVESIQQGIVVLNQSGRILSINEFMRRHFGWEDDAIQRDLLAYRPQMQRLLANALRRVLEDGLPQDLLGQRLRQVDTAEDLVVNVYMYPLRTAEIVRGAVLLFEDATERARLEQNIEARANQLAALTEVSSRINAALHRDDVIALVLAETEHVIRYDCMSVWELDGDDLVLTAWRGFEPEAEPVRVPVAHADRLARVISTQRAVAECPIQPGTSLPGEEAAQSWLGTPLIEQGQVVGMITLAKAEAAFYDTQAEQAAQAFANQVAVALANASLFEEAQSRTQRLSLLNRVSVDLAHSLDSENIMEIALREIANAMGIAEGRAYLFERETNVARAVVDLPRGDAPPSEFFEIVTNPVMQQIATTTQPVLIEDIARLPADDPIRREIAARGITAYALLPMNVSGQVSGAFELCITNGPHKFDTEKLDLALIIANQAAVTVLNANLLEQTLVRTRELETLLEAAQATSYTLDLDQVFHSVIQLTLQALDMDDCAIMMYDNVEETLKVELDLNRQGDESQITPTGTVFDLREYPAKWEALHENKIMVIRVDDPAADPREVAEMRTNSETARMLVPLMVREQLIGMLQVELRSYFRTFTHREIRMAQALGAQAAIAIENARLSTETAAQVEQSLLINELSRAMSSTMDIRTITRIVRSQVPALTEAGAIYLAIYDTDSDTIEFPMSVKHRQDHPLPPRALNNDEISFVLRNRRMLVLGGDNPSADEVRRNLKIEPGRENAVRYLGVPLIVSDESVGALAIYDDDQTRPFGLNQQRILTTVGAQLGVALQNAQLFERIRNFANELETRVEERTTELQQERDRIEALYEVTAELGRSLEIDRVVETALRMVSASIDADDAVVLLVDARDDQLYTRAVLHGGTEGRLERGGTGRHDDHERLPHPVEMLANWLYRHDHSVLVRDLNDAPYWNADAPGASSWCSALGVVLEANQEARGVIVFLGDAPNKFDESQLKLVIAAANQVAAAVNNAELYHLLRGQTERTQQLLRAAKEQAEQNRAILEGIADGVMLADARGEIVLFNDAAERILDLPRHRAIGERLASLTEHYGDASEWVLLLNEWVTTPQIDPSEDLMLERLDLGRRIVSIHSAQVHNADEFLGTVSVFRDVTRDVEVDRMKSEFISNVSHELRTPMTSIKAYADLLMINGAGPLSDQQKMFVSKVKSNADRMTSLVNDLLNISRIDTGNERLKLESVDMADLIRKVLTNLQGREHHERKQLTINFTVAPDMPPIIGDSLKLTQIVTNLIDNAFNYTYAGGKIEVEAKRAAERGYVLVTVADTGIGIPEDFQSRIWDRFERYEEHALVMDVPGTGLGLPIVKTLVEMHRGKIWFDSEVNRGTTFYLLLPISGPTGTNRLPALASDASTPDTNGTHRSDAQNEASEVNGANSSNQESLEG